MKNITKYYKERIFLFCTHNVRDQTNKFVARKCLFNCCNRVVGRRSKIPRTRIYARENEETKKSATADYTVTFNFRVPRSRLQDARESRWMMTRFFNSNGRFTIPVVPRNDRRNGKQSLSRDKFDAYTGNNYTRVFIPTIILRKSVAQINLIISFPASKMLDLNTPLLSSQQTYPVFLTI